MMNLHEKKTGILHPQLLPGFPTHLWTSLPPQSGSYLIPVYVCSVLELQNIFIQYISCFPAVL